MLLPKVITQALGKCGTIALPRVGYKEHQHAWQEFSVDGGSWRCIFYDDFPTQSDIDASDVVLVINPNNPTGVDTAAESLVNLRDQMNRKGGFLILDEAFMDCTPERSVLNKVQNLSSLVVLRSVGKFFGLAGVRTGFVFSSPNVLSKIAEYQGPWTVTGPSRFVVKTAMQDSVWQSQTREKILQTGQRLERLLSDTLACQLSASSLFVTAYVDNAPRVHELLCRAKVLTRLCDEGNALRFGLPEHEWQWQQLELALQQVYETNE
ncbi:aminotransferase class I/II-fold pyridoxal phosphate-dependent enzyme [Vibrio sonorensis]|uniref:aminotransferase class I/II-fold pyridoxal phosphate-dependent enzyme n=1 Tax=Vibrio sonorensis TaxID=1004316 RepID=UPI0015865751|nr:aminotransferase class I/II-fold pyridoxal phosphate-dependent enzyme [Vibrio sonorensis]